MKKLLNILTPIALVTALVFYSSCGGDDSGGNGDPDLTEQETVTLRLEGGSPWGIGSTGSVSLDNSDLTADFANFSITFSGMSLTVSGSDDDVWPNGTATWSYVGTDTGIATSITRSDGVEVSISVNEASTTLTLQFEITGGSGGRVLGKEGSWTITVAGGAG